MTTLEVDQDMVMSELRQLVELSVTLFESNAEMTIKAKAYSRMVDLAMAIEDWTLAMVLIRRLKEVMSDSYTNRDQ